VTADVVMLHQRTRGAS